MSLNSVYHRTVPPSPVPTRILNLTFHGIGSPPRRAEHETWNWLTVSEFSATLDAVRERSDVRLTFDDSYRSDFEVALPELQCRELTGTFFAVTGRIGQRDFITPEHLRAMVEAGMTIGSHGMNHRPWRRLTDAELDEELVRARAMLEDILGQPVDEAACPFGAYDRRTVQGLRRAHYRHVFTSDRGWASPGDWMQPRYTLAGNPDPEVVERLASGGAPGPLHPLQPLKNAIKRWR